MFQYISRLVGCALRPIVETQFYPLAKHTVSFLLKTVQIDSNIKLLHLYSYSRLWQTGIHDCAPCSPWAVPIPAWDIILWLSKTYFYADSSVKWELFWLLAKVILCISQHDGTNLRKSYWLSVVKGWSCFWLRIMSDWTLMFGDLK